MDIKKIVEGLGEKRDELFKMAIKCKSAEELLAVAIEQDVALDKAGATELFEAMTLTICKLSDDELDDVAGGYYVNKLIKAE
ncbi:hypothetical protein [Desulfosporosinus lacus]|uniref:Nif11-like leader peptide domain-containing protein n=1 Tax=Desulfosporosinus lacus DSM 15449 TaxID=1121420 RepID=A0A1M5QZJ0_9FIRM|nr:hypothetical protein [Desulfosporosinus lacus]SHH18953.1 hypothetical protein SAMN02746098_00401 [Desulfosporosinus lacus DSM 15449]